MLSPGMRLGLYEIVSSLGAGGMGEVYRATDTKLGRAVAIKVLPDTFAADAERVTRFAREAKVLASLNHPHIAALYGMESAEAGQFLVMELVEGDTLADRLRGGPLTVVDAVDVAIQIADALDAAHEQGVVHRDLKPANVKVTPAGKVKVLDFGIAKAAEPASSASNVTHSPTLSVLATQAGMIMGTAAYMSPEQAKGLAVDRRSDVFSFGVVLYEMLTGRQPFRGDTAAEIMASVMIRDADLEALPASLPPRLREIIVRCLDKQPRRRWQSLGDLRVELETLRDAGPMSVPASAAPRSAARTSFWTVALPMAAAVVVTAGITAWLAGRPQPTPPPPVVRFALPAPGMQLSVNSIALSPDSSTIAYVAAAESGQFQVVIRRLSDFTARAVEGTRGAIMSGLVFSPDGRSLAYFSEGAIVRVHVDGGPLTTICRPSGLARGLSWHGSTMFFSAGRAIYRVADTGGEPEAVTEFEPLQAPSQVNVVDDRGSLLLVLSSIGDLSRRQVVLQSASGTRTVLSDNGVNAHYLPTGHVAYVSNGTLMAVPVDLAAGRATGPPTPLLQGIQRALSTAPVFHVTVSANGTLAYVQGRVGSTDRRVLALVGVDGRAEVLPFAPHAYGSPRVSPDGRRVAVEIEAGGQASIWVGSLDEKLPMRRLTLDGRNRGPVWTRDSQSIAFQSDREGDAGIFVQRADGSQPAQRLTRADPGTRHFAESWTVDDRQLAIRIARDLAQGAAPAVRTARNSTVWIASRDGAALRPLIQDEGRVALASAFSPDGKWLAYASNESIGTGWSVFVQPFPPSGARYQLTTELSSSPIWSSDGKQLFYAYTNRVFRADLRIDQGVSLGPATELETSGSHPSLPEARHFDVMPDGKRLLVLMPEGGETTAQSPQINVVLNWLEELRQRQSAR